jgi:hypothetical protein
MTKPVTDPEKNIFTLLGGRIRTPVYLGRILARSNMDRVRNNGIKWTLINTKSTNFAAKMMEGGSPILQTYYFLDIRWGAYQLNVNWSRNRSTLIKQVPYRYLPVQFHKRTSDLTNNWLIFAKRYEKFICEEHGSPRNPFKGGQYR